MKKLPLVLLLLFIFSCSESEPIPEPETEIPAVIEKEEAVDNQGNDDGNPQETGGDEETNIEIDLPQTWKLFKVTCHTSETCESTGENMPYQDTYTFNEDFTLKKLRIKDNDTLRIEGKFEVNGTEFETYAFNINYEGEPAIEDIDIISSCISRKEYLFITEEDEGILKNEVSECDGPDLYYSRVTE